MLKHKFLTPLLLEMNLQDKSSAGLCVLNANSFCNFVGKVILIQLQGVKIDSSKAGYDLFLLIVQYQAE